MGKLKKKIDKLIQRFIDKVTGNGLMQEELEAEGERYINPGMPELLRQAGAEGCVLLKNDGALPLDPERMTAVFGRCQLDWFYVGYGSGGDVKAPYFVNLIEGMQNAGITLEPNLLKTYVNWTQSEEHQADHGWWGHWPMNYPEMPLSNELVRKAAENCDTAVIVIGRAAGEDRENTLTEGSYYLTREERSMLDAVTSSFRKVAVLLNIGNIIDLSWAEEYKDRISSILIVWQGGMESGNAVADVLLGKINPSGKLSDTIARRYEDYPSSANFGGKQFNEYAEGVFVGYRYFDRHPESVLYPFGFGLSYTQFSVHPESFVHNEAETCSVITVTNTGGKAGKEVVQLFCALPSGNLEKPIRVLVAFGKTEVLAPGESETLTFRFSDKCFSSYDEESHCFVLEPGEYRFLANDTEAGRYTVSEKIIIEQCEPLLRKPEELRQRITDRLPKEMVPSSLETCTFYDVMEEKANLEDFVARLSNEELEALSRGHGMMNSPLGVAGNAGAFCGILESLRGKGVPPVITSDGPAGLRLKKRASLLPCGTALACTWNTGLIEEIGKKSGEEMCHYGVDVLLSPGMNIHRNPLCGRNFEYFSEDPLLSGKMAAADVRGIQSSGRSACPKHFACNNQETKRNTNDSRVSERALREIYLRNFEIAVKEGKPLTIMTSYNKVNGVWSHYNYDLVTTVLRKEWGFDGCVITDWWMQKAKSPEFPLLENNAYRVRAQVDVLMPGDIGYMAKEYKTDPSLLKTLGQPGGITKAELQRTAANTLNLALKLKKSI